jgi:hypothetical protein
MSDLERDLAERLHRADLPAAPASLHARLQAVIAAPPARRGTGIGKQGRLLLPLAAVLVIGVLAATGAGKGPIVPPSSPAVAAHAALTVKAATYECCSPGALDFRVELQGPGGPWRGSLSTGGIGQMGVISPRLPEVLTASGTYLLTTEIRVFGDVLVPGQDGPPDYGPAATCTSEFTVEPDTTVVEITLAYWLNRCSAGTIVTPDPVSLATLEVRSSIDDRCGVDVGGCDYRLLLSGPGGTWAATIQTATSTQQLETNELPLFLSPGAYRLEAESHRLDVEAVQGSGYKADLGVATACTVDFTVAPESTGVTLDVAFEAETCSADAEVERVVFGTPPSSVGPVATQPPPVACPFPVPPQMSCDQALAAILDALGPDHQPIASIEFLMACQPIPDGHCGLTTAAKVQFATPGTPTVELVLRPDVFGWVAEIVSTPSAVPPPAR